MQPDKTLEETYVVGEGDVSISAVIGNAQFGVIDVRFKGDSAPLGREDNVVNVSLGKGSDIIGKTLLVRTLVSDVNPFTNRMIVTYTLNGGLENDVHALRDVVDEEGELIYFRASFTFVAANQQEEDTNDT